MILLREISLSFIHQPHGKKLSGCVTLSRTNTLSIDPEVIFATVKIRLVPLLTDLRHVLADIDNVLQEKPKEGEKK